MNNDYKNKYLKYKTKYLNKIKMKGGTYFESYDPFIPFEPFKSFDPNTLILLLNKLNKLKKTIGVIGPGAGRTFNMPAYKILSKQYNILDIGKSNQQYDKYPPGWSDQTSNGPNLETFAEYIINTQIINYLDFLIVGSRGGQVVLPYLWRKLSYIPPTLIINGGCIKKSGEIIWPDNAISCVLLGGNDYFLGKNDDYLKKNKGIYEYLKHCNIHTIIIYIDNMEHMPQQELMNIIILYLILLLDNLSQNIIDEIIFDNIIKKLKNKYPILFIYYINYELKIKLSNTLFINLNINDIYSYINDYNIQIRKRLQQQKYLQSQE
jgi:hypothetical protein